MPHAGHCPAAEDLAAYIDGNLGRAESQRVTEHLASCEDCYAVYTETLHFQLDTSPATPADKEENMVRFPSADAQGKAAAASGRLPIATARWLPIAALLLVVVGGTYFQLLASPPELVTARVAPPLPSPPPGVPPMWLGPTYRGESSGEQVKPDEGSFRMGVQLVNLQASLRAGKKEEAQNVISYILGLLKPQSFSQELYKDYSGITATLDKKTPKEVLPEVSRLARESRDVFEPAPLDLGQWVEAGRLTALAHDPSFFKQADTRTFLRRLRWREKLGIGDMKLDPAARESLERIAEIVSKGDLQASDYDELKARFDKILGIYYPET